MKTHARILIVPALVAVMPTGAIDAQTSVQATQAPRPAAVPSSVPLCAGLRIVTAISGLSGDFESIKTVEAVTPTAVRMKYSAEAADQQASSKSSDVRKVRAARTIRSEDLRSATRYARYFSDAHPELLTGTTALGTSAAVLESLRASGQAELAVPNEGLLAAVQRSSSDRITLDDIEFASHTITRVGRIMLPVVVNDAPVQLPAIHARGRFFGEDAEFYFLDDPRNPIALRYAVSKGEFSDLLGTLTGLLGGGGPRQADRDTRDLLQVVKISYHCAPPPAPPAGTRSSNERPAPVADISAARPLERALSETGRADVYSLFFSFNSDQIREESEPTLKEIAALMVKHPEWKLSIEGHTDGVASDGFNLDLSRRRAAAVKNALTARYGLNASRFTTAGHGESRPKDTNETLEGRARNRRVELVRQP